MALMITRRKYRRHLKERYPVAFERLKQQVSAFEKIIYDPLEEFKEFLFPVTEDRPSMIDELVKERYPVAVERLKQQVSAFEKITVESERLKQQVSAEHLKQQVSAFEKIIYDPLEESKEFLLPVTGGRPSMIDELVHAKLERRMNGFYDCMDKTQSAVDIYGSRDKTQSAVDIYGSRDKTQSPVDLIRRQEERQKDIYLEALREHEAEKQNKENQQQTEGVVIDGASKKVIQANNNDLEFSGLLKIPEKVDGWFRAIDDMTKDFYSKYKKMPNITQAWAHLFTNPPHGYEIKEGKDKWANCLKMPGEVYLDKKNFAERWKKYTKDKTE